ncbi:MAG TPA: chaperone NapD [Geminicoccaceae bacterium]|nr:chaperone NapD [Geminicoccus sp.]HMU51690.1 chaperone NapD [Geminicoccaceae bacterium]
MPAELHVSSLAVQARPERLAPVCAGIGLVEGAEVHQTDPAGKIVVTLETANERQVLERIEAIRTLRGVLNVALVFHRIDTEPV